MMHILRPFVLLFASVAFSSCLHGQALNARDFEVGHLKLRSPIDSVLAHLSKPHGVYRDGIYEDYLGAFYLTSNYDSVLARLRQWQEFRKDLHYSDYLTAKYRTMVIWYNKFNKLVKGFDIQDSTFSTARGLRVGDPSSKLTRIYGNGRLIAQLSTDGPYDLSFHDFSQIRLYSSGDYHLAFFIKDQLVTKISVFFCLTLHEQDWSMGFLKLSKRFDAITAKLGKPDSTTPGDYGWTGFFFPKLVLWRDNETNTLCAMDIYDSSYVTHRGLRVGSPSSDVERLYGDRGEVDPVFERTGPYDSAFHAYDFSTTFVYDRNFFVVFSKAQKVVKILMYVGVND